MLYNDRSLIYYERLTIEHGEKTYIEKTVKSDLH